MYDQNTLNAAWNSAPSSAPATPKPQPKGPGGIKGFLINSLPAIGSGLGAVAGIPLDFLGGAGSIAGGAVGGGLGETLKRKLLGENLDAKQIGIQALEGGVTSAINPLKMLKGASGATKAFVKGGAQVAEDAAAGTAEKTASKGSFLKNLTTQGQQAQGRVSGISAGSKAAGKELTPQDTEQMLSTLKQEGIKTGNANNTLRDVHEAMKNYGKQISDHFTANNAPLHPDDTKQIANNFIASLKTTDPEVLKQAQIIADDLQKNVTDTKSLWEFRKTLDSRIPDSKFVDAATSNKVAALKSARQFISDELGAVPGVKNYHDLAEIKPFISKEANRLNNPGGGIVGRVLSSGPVQTIENGIGKATEKIGQLGDRAESTVVPDGAKEFASTAKGTQPILDKVLTKRGIPVKYESDTLVGKGVADNKRVTLTNPKVSDIEDELNNLKGNGYSVNQRLGATSGSKTAQGFERGLTPDFTPIEQSPKLSSVELTGKKTNIPLQQQGETERGIIHTPDEYSNEIPENVLQSASDEAKATPEPPTPVGTGFMNKLLKTSKSVATLPVRAAAAPLAYPGQSAGAVLKQEAARGFGVPASVSQAQQQGTADQSTPDISGAITQASDNSPQATNNPYDPANVEANVRAIMQQGGTQKDVADYLVNVEKYQSLTTPTSKLNSTQQQQANNANSGLSDIQSISDMLSKDPSLTLKSSLPGGSVVQRLTGTTDYEAAKNNIVDVISRLRSGAAISASEEKLYKSLLPSAGDSVESANSKLTRLANLLNSFANPGQ